MPTASPFHRMVRRGHTLFGVLLGLSISCSAPTESANKSEAPGTNQPPSTPAPAPPPRAEFPALARPGVIYVEADAIYAYSLAFHNSLIDSRYVFYDDNSFELQFVSGRFGFFTYTGRLRREDTRITFDWDGWSVAGPWGAVGTVRGDSLHVEYNLIMQHSDFLNGVYLKSAASP